jgi:hypothetical protein
VKRDEDIQAELEAKHIQDEADEATRSGRERLRHRPLGRRKEQFVVTFIESGRAASYPAPAEDLRDENFWDRRAGKQIFTASHVGNVPEELAAQIARAYEVSAEPSDVALPIAHVLAQDLLDSADHELVCKVSTMPFAQISVERLLAHVESLSLSLSARLKATIARRAFLVLLNNHSDMEDLRVARR